ncbi:Rrf2 family transcriptional regulator [Paenibacillus abyssi]|uniref:HTH-type transcriptional regulator NsrR n=1 Tax=Paenibacillus abyssi TaxID=1340531 RepID=A0A917FV09_9BACL|nr:Rrf2 family transcriptional regulator [Paenibacillus abyssi]GGG07819.1 hypothetical protein GCM10010916_25880 [Paenibacillus abyssi]
MQLLIQSGDLGPTWFHVSLRALVLLSKSSTRMKSQHIANTLGAEPTYVRKIMAGLSKAGIVSAYGGREGGYRLAKPAGAIRVGEVYRALGKGQVTPFWNVPSTGSEQFLSLLISKAEEQFQSVLDAYTIEDIVREGAHFSS